MFALTKFGKLQLTVEPNVVEGHDCWPAGMLLRVAGARAHVERRRVGVVKGGGRLSDDQHVAVLGCDLERLRVEGGGLLVDVCHWADDSRSIGSNWLQSTGLVVHCR